MFEAIDEFCEGLTHISSGAGDAPTCHHGYDSPPESDLADFGQSTGAAHELRLLALRALAVVRRPKPESTGRGVRAYVVREVVEFCAIVVGLAIAACFVRIPLWIGIGIPLGKILSSFGFYFLLLRESYLRVPRHAPEAWIGQSGRTLSWLDEQGFIRVHGEIWSARSQQEESVPPDCDVRITGIQGSVLLVRQVQKGER